MVNYFFIIIDFKYFTKFKYLKYCKNVENGKRCKPTKLNLEFIIIINSKHT
jgi:hypothetical protein